MLQFKKEQFRQQIRRQRLDAHFMKSRYQMLSIQQTHQNQLILDTENSPMKPDQVQIKKDISSILTNIFNQQLIDSNLKQLQEIVDQYQAEEFENIFVQFFLGERLLEIYNKEKDLTYITEIQYILASITKKSLICKAKLLELNILQIITQVVSFEIEYDDYCVLSLVYLMTTFVEFETSTCSDQNKQILLANLEKLSGKLLSINYLDINIQQDESSNEIQYSILQQILYFLNYLISQFSIPIKPSNYKNVWKILINLAFFQNDASSLRINVLQVIAEILKQSDQVKLNVLQNNPQILFWSLELFEQHITYNTINNCIRLQASLIFKYLFSVQSFQIINDIHNNKIPYYFLEYVKVEEYRKAFFHQMDAIYLLCDQSTFEQCIEIYDNGLLTLIISNFQEIKDTHNFVLCKILLKLTYTILKQSQYNQKISSYFLQYNIKSFLDDIIINCKNLNIKKRANKILNYFNI